MNRTARNLFPAVAVVAVLGAAWGTTAAIGDTGRAAQRRSSTTTTTTLTDTALATPAPVIPAAPPTPTTPTTFPPTTVKAATWTQATSVSLESPHVVLPDLRPADRRGVDCGLPADGSYRPTSEPAFRTAMTRVWLLCTAPSFFGTDEAGLEVRADGSWSKLEWKANGTLVRAAGPSNEGSWSTLDTSAMNGRPTYQINFQVQGAGESSATPRFGAEASRVRLDNMGLFVADYVAAPPGTPVLPERPSPANGCDAADPRNYRPSTVAEFQAAISGSWLLCGAPSFFGTGEAGLEIRRDGRWSKLFRGPGRSLVRGHGPGNEGTWRTIDTSFMNGGPTYQMDFLVDGAGLSSATPAFRAQGAHVTNVRLDNMGLFVADYVPAPAGTPIS